MVQVNRINLFVMMIQQILSGGDLTEYGLRYSGEGWPNARIRSKVAQCTTGYCTDGSCAHMAFYGIETVVPSAWLKLIISLQSCLTRN